MNTILEEQIIRGGEVMKESTKSEKAASIFVFIFFIVVAILLVILSRVSHKFNGTPEIIKKATCTEEGLVKYHCTKIGCDYTREEKVEPLGHDYDDGTVIVESACKTDGKIEYVCKTCNYKKDEVIPAGHKFDEEVVREATCTVNGRILKVCSVCGYEETEEIPKSHNFVNKTCTECKAYKADEIKADIWYKSKDIPYFKCKNGVIVSATATSNGVSALYYPVCRECHICHGNLGFGAPTYNYNYVEFYVCPDCGATTEIVLALSK